MPDTEHKLAQEKAAMQRLAKALGVTDKELRVEGNDATMTRIHTIERIAEILEQRAKRESAEAKAAGKQPPVTVETVKEAPMKTTETVEVKAAKS